jgi:hypothetical protein
LLSFLTDFRFSDTKQRLMAKLAKQKAASQPTAPKATAVDSIDDESATESPASLAPETAAAAAAPAAAPAAPKWYELNSVKAALFFSIVPICFALPFAAEYVVEWTRPYGTLRRQ